jgi:hypothetical protein
MGSEASVDRKFIGEINIAPGARLGSRSPPDARRQAV